MSSEYVCSPELDPCPDHELIYSDKCSICRARLSLYSQIDNRISMLNRHIDQFDKDCSKRKSEIELEKQGWHVREDAPLDVMCERLLKSGKIVRAKFHYDFDYVWTDEDGNYLDYGPWRNISSNKE